MTTGSLQKELQFTTAASLFIPYVNYSLEGNKNIIRMFIDIVTEESISF